MYWRRDSYNCENFSNVNVNFYIVIGSGYENVTQRTKIHTSTILYPLHYVYGGMSFSTIKYGTAKAKPEKKTLFLSVQEQFSLES